MPRKSKQHNKQFKLDAIQYVNEYPNLTYSERANNLGIGISTLGRWISQYKNNEGDIPTKGSENHNSYEQKEISRLKRELRHTQDALHI